MLKKHLFDKSFKTKYLTKYKSGAEPNITSAVRKDSSADPRSEDYAQPHGLPHTVSLY